MNVEREVTALRDFWQNLPSATTSKCLCAVPRECLSPCITVVHPPQEGPDQRRRAAKVQIELDLLQLKDGTLFPGREFSKLLVRKQYVAFAKLAKDIIDGKVKGNDGQVVVKHLIVGGTPGTGKTTFGLYLLCHLRGQPEYSGRQFIWEETLELDSVSYYFKDQDVRIGKAGDFDSLAGATALYFVDGPVLRIRLRMAHVFMFSFDKDGPKATKQLMREINKRRVYMPLWDLSELCLAYASRGRMSTEEDFKRVEALYIRWGGSVRAVLDMHDDEDYLTKFESALGNAKNSKLEIVDLVRENRESSSYIFHLRVVDQECTRVAISYASPYARREIEKQRTLKNLGSVLKYVETHKMVPEESFVVGRRWEFLVHTLLSRADIGQLTFNARRLSRNNGLNLEEKQVVFDLAGSFELFRKLREIAVDSVGYFIPDYPTTDPCYSSLARMKDGSCRLLQMTRNVYHPALFQCVDAAIERFGTVSFYYAVPHEMYKKYPYQKIMWGDKEDDWPCDVWVLDIPKNLYRLVDVPNDQLTEVPLFANYVEGLRRRKSRLQQAGDDETDDEDDEEDEEER